jgi:hypothetical protein
MMSLLTTKIALLLLIYLQMVAAGDLEGAQSQVIEAATDQGVGFTQSFLEKYFPTVEISFSTKEGTKTNHRYFSRRSTLRSERILKIRYLPKSVHSIQITEPH